MIADYEAAWIELGEALQSREGWGSKQLAAEMQKILARHRTSESAVERILRLYGNRVTIVLSNPEAPATGLGANGDDLSSPATASAPVPGHSKTKEVANGNRSAAGAV